MFIASTVLAFGGGEGEKREKKEKPFVSCHGVELIRLAAGLCWLFVSPSRLLPVGWHVGTRFAEGTFLASMASEVHCKHPSPVALVFV